MEIQWIETFGMQLKLYVEEMYSYKYIQVPTDVVT